MTQIRNDNHISQRALNTKAIAKVTPQADTKYRINTRQFTNIVNQQPKRIGKQRQKSQEFTAIQRFIDDSLHRFAKGLCDLPIPGEKSGNFPNPFRKSPMLRSV